MVSSNSGNSFPVRNRKTVEKGYSSGNITWKKQNNVVNHILIEAKYYIYICKLEKSIPTYRRLKNRLKITESIEREIARKTLNKTKQHTYKWHHLMEHLLDTWTSMSSSHQHFIRIASLYDNNIFSSSVLWISS